MEKFWDKTYGCQYSSSENDSGISLAERQSTPSGPGPKTLAGRAKSLSLCSHSDARKLIPYQTAEQWQVLPLGLSSLYDGVHLCVAAAVGASPDLAAALRFACGYPVRVVEVDADILHEAIFISYHRESSALCSHIATLRAQAKNRESTSGLDLRAATSDSAKFLAVLIDYAIAQEASDIHISPRHDGSFVRLRVNGELLDHDAAVADLKQHEQLISRIKVLASLDTTQRRLPQDGSFGVNVGQRRLHIRVSTLPTVHGEKAVLRIMNNGSHLELQDLGLCPAAQEMLQKHLTQAEGAILVAGSTGSGKTTTLYAALRNLQKRGLQIASVEDPVEVPVDGVSQTSIDPAIGLTYSECLKAILRQDPDVIMLGEIRDANSAQIALHASLTGHLVLATVHARSVIEIISRLKVLNIDTLSVAQSVSLLMCQRLLRRLCSKCKVVDFLESREFGNEIYRPVGCAACDYSGFNGSLLVSEMLEVGQELRDILLRGSEMDFTLSEETSGYISMKSQICNLIRAGEVYSKDCLL
ncbi:MAG: GspE/PulE family protein [Oligoflexia bacterium]|nr:GspE/PulE family protein [Oligoflexia bacterium]